jgi:hypothetical protein
MDKPITYFTVEMPKSCNIVNCRTGYKLTAEDKKKSCMDCSAGKCDCVKFDCVCKSSQCKCPCSICKPKIFSFPNEPVSRENWKRACPNVFSDKQQDLKACEWHWPDNYATVSPVKNSHLCSRKPRDAPSIFKDAPASCSRTGFVSPRRTERSSFEIRTTLPDELNEFETWDLLSSFETYKVKAVTAIDEVKCLECDGNICIYYGPVQQMSYCLLVFQDMKFKMYVRGVQVKSHLRVTVLKRMSQLEELMR